MNSLVISEKFYSIQGEGATMGIPSVFIRLAGCNLLCKSESWICDSIEVWQKGVKTPFNQVLTDEQLSHVLNGAHLIFTGGEPLLHQKKIVEYLDWFFEEYHMNPYVEVETNGTIIPSDDMISFVDQWNCSPKLANSGEPFSKRVNEVAINKINHKGKSSIFKFVVEKNEDVLDLLNDYGDHIFESKIALMPAGETQEKLNTTRPIVVQQCMKMGWRYSERLHIVIWNQKTGV